MLFPRGEWGVGVSQPFSLYRDPQVYQVIHEGVVKAAKKTSLRRLALRPEGIDRVFGRFVKELYILSRMRSDRWVLLHLCC